MISQSDARARFAGARRLTRRGALAGTMATLCLGACGDDGPIPPAAIAIVGESARAGVAGGLAADPLEVKITGAKGGPAAGAIVTFVASEGGGAVTPAVDTADANGLASTRWRFGGAVGSQRVTASVTGVTSAATFTATVSAAAPAAVSIQAGNNQSATAGTAVTVPPAVLVRDRFNNPVAGTTVLFSVDAGGGSVTAAGATTNASGIATVGSWTLGSTIGTNRLLALVVANGITGNPVTFTATGTAGSAASLVAQTATAIAGSVNTLVTPLPSVRVLDAGGNGVAGVPVNFVASSGSLVNGAATITVTTGSSGVATLASWQLGTTAGSYTLVATAGGLAPVVFTAAARAAAPAQVAVSAGNNQTAAFGRTLPIDPAVRVTDAYGNGVSGLEVVFEVTGGGGAALVRRPVTDADGVATVGAWTLGDAPGANTLRATVTTNLTLAGNPVTFSATATAGTASALAVQAGNQQSATVGTAVATAPAVVVRDARGNGVPGVTVTFAPGAGSGTVSGATVVTGSNGVATVGGWTLGTTAGAQTLTASAAGITSVSFTATATAGAVVRLEAQGDTVLENVAITSFVAPLPQVKAVDQYGNPVAGVTVVFSSILGASTLTGESRLTGSDGLATLGSWRVSPTLGIHRIRVTAQGVNLGGLEPTFRVYAIGAAANVIVAPTSIQNQAATASAAVATIPVVRVVDANGFGVYGASVTFTVTTGTATVGAAPGAAAITVTTDTLGFASASAWTMGAGSGARTLTASVAGIVGTVVFTATVP